MLLDETIQALRDEIAYLRSELGIVHGLSDIERLRPLAKQEAALVLTLYHAHRGSILPPHMLVSSEDYGDTLVRVLICKIRSKMPAIGIETVRGLGYRMTDQGRAYLTARLAQ